jgi:phospholipase A1
MIRKVLILILVLFTVSSLMGQTSSIFKKMETYKSLAQIWELEPETSGETFLMTTYKPVYVLPFRFSSHRRDVPFEQGDETTNEEPIQLDNIEATLQFSLKTKLARGIFGKADLWLGYTQKSYWQVYNKEFSRPFRETNYEPEIIFNHPAKFNFLGLKAKMIGFAFNHQSNGREGEKFTRSWFRFIMHAGFEDKQWSLVVRTWIASEFSENPDIKNYMGRGDVTFNYRLNRNLLTLHAQHSLRLGSDNQGHVEFDWAFPIHGNLKGYFQFFHGYGDAMIDYNQIHTIGGIGIVFTGSL